MEPKGPLPLSQEHSTCPYPQPDQCNSCPKPIFYSSSLILSSHSCIGLPSCFFPSGFPSNILHAPFPHSCYMHRPIIFLHLVRNVHETLIIRYTLTKIIRRTTTVIFALQLCISLAQRLKQEKRTSIGLSLCILT